MEKLVKVIFNKLFVSNCFLIYLNLDIDECSSNNGNCPETCTNTDGSFECTCKVGSKYDLNKQTCESK